MAPSKPSSSVTNTIKSITRNWKIDRVHECLPRALWPNKQFEATQWDLAILTLLSQISAIPNATIQDFRAKARRAIKSRQERNGTTAGKVGWVKVTDLKSVLKEYEKEAADAEAEKEVEEEVKSPVNTLSEFKELPKTPVAPDYDSEDEEEEGSSEPLPGGKYQYLSHVRPLKVDLNPMASASKKPIRAKPTRGKKRQVEEEAAVEPSTTEKPNLVQQDPDPRAPDDTGFLSDLEPEKEKQKERKKKRLSRLEQHRVRVPHWQRDLDEVAGDASLLSNGAGIADAVLPEEASVNARDEEVTLEMDLDELPSIPENATVTERKEMEELRLRMEQRIWRIKVLKIKEREGNGDDIVGLRDLENEEEPETLGEDENAHERVDARNNGDEADVDEEHEPDDTDGRGERRVLRSRKGK